MKKIVVTTGAVIASLFLAQSVFAQTATPTTTTSPTTTVSPTPTTSVQVPQGAPATGRGGN